LHKAVFLPAVDALAPVEELPSRYEDYAGWPVAAGIQRVGNSAHETIEFTLDQCTRLRLYAIGEAHQQDMVDYGYVESAATGQIVWQMHYFETESAGYYRNRQADRPLTLPAGTYRLHFETDGAHAFDDWGDRPPGHRFWGVVLFVEPESEANPPACWQRAESPEEVGWSSAGLTQIVPELERLDVAALMVVTGGQVVFEWGNTANNFAAHSMRKSLLSALYGIYVAEGEIELSKTLAELGIDDLNPLTEGEKQATVRELLQARSGIYIPAAGESKGMSAGRPERGSHKPGTHWYYNNWDFNALGTIFHQGTGEQDIYRAFQTRIADPIAMQDYFPDRLNYNYSPSLSQHPYYGFRISARDLARFGQLFLQEGVWDSGQIIPAGWVEESTRAYSKTEQSGTSSGYGYMWWVAVEDLGPIKTGTYCASGYGGHTLEVLPHLHTVIVIRFNTDVPGFENLAGAPVDRLISTILESRTR
jgi:CubicO group peptidase (beta-lactamase class C family)